MVSRARAAGSGTSPKLVRPSGAGGGVPFPAERVGIGREGRAERCMGKCVARVFAFMVFLAGLSATFWAVNVMAADW